MKTTAQIFKALADETRLRIVALLLHGELCVCDLIAALELPQSTVSRHLSYLRNAGWVQDRRQGIWMYYKLRVGEKPLMSDVVNALSGHLDALPQAGTDLMKLQAFQVSKSKSDCD